MLLNASFYRFREDVIGDEQPSSPYLFVVGKRLNRSRIASSSRCLLIGLVSRVLPAGPLRYQAPSISVVLEELGRFVRDLVTRLFRESAPHSSCCCWAFSPLAGGDTRRIGHRRVALSVVRFG